MDDRSAERSNALECRVKIGHGEVGQRHRVARARAAVMDPDRRPVRSGLPAAALGLGPLVQFGREHA